MQMLSLRVSATVFRPIQLVFRLIQLVVTVAACCSSWSAIIYAIVELESRFSDGSHLKYRLGQGTGES